MAKVTWTVKLTVEPYATSVKFTDTLGENFSFVEGSFKLDGKTIESQPTIEGQTATIENLGSLLRGVHTITYETKLKSDVSVNNGEYINEQGGSKNTAAWEWGGPNDRQNGTATAAPSQFRYDMINKSNGSGTSSDIKWTVRLNQGELKADMSGCKFTDKLDNKQTYSGSYYTVYKGTSESDGVRIDEGALDSSKDTFSYTFRDDLDDKYATYCIVYHTRMNDTNSYDTVHNNATIEHEGRVLGAAEGKFTPQLMGTPITKRRVSSDEAGTTGRATWETKVALKAIVNAVHPDKVTVKDTFQSAWSQNLGIDVDSISITIGETVLKRGQNADWDLTANWTVGGTKRNFNLDINVNDKVKAALENEDYAVITYTTTSDALPGWYSNFASVSASGLNLQRQYTDLVMYVVNKETTPAVEKPEAESKVSWNESFDWSSVDGSAEKGAWLVDWTVYANRQQGNKGANGEYEYYGAGKLGNKPLNIVDTFPDGMSYVVNSGKYTLVQNPYDQHAGYGSGSEAETIISGKQLECRQRVKATVARSPSPFLQQSLVNLLVTPSLTYRTAVKRGKLDTSTNEVKFTNSASAKSGEKEFSSGSGTVTIKNNVINKTGERVLTAIASSTPFWSTSLRLPLRAALTSSSSSTPWMPSARWCRRTLKVYERMNGAWSPLADEDYSSEMEQVKDESGSRTKLTLNVPDKKYLKVEYEVIPSGNPGDEVSLSNTAMLTGVTDGSAIDDQKWIVKSASATAGGNGYGITMTKYDAQQVGATLEGAEFTLYSVAMDGAGETDEEFQTAKTDGSGKISFGTSTKKMTNCVLYKLVESKAPEGYDTTSPTWIMLKGDATTEEYQAALEKARDVVGNAEIIGDAEKDKIWIYDNRLTVSTEIKAKKVLEGGTFKEGQFSFELKDGEGKVLQTVTNDAEGNVSFPSSTTRREPIPTRSPRSFPRTPRATSRITLPMTRPSTRLRLSWLMATESSMSPSPTVTTLRLHRPLPTSIRPRFPRRAGLA